MFLKAWRKEADDEGIQDARGDKAWPGCKRDKSHHSMIAVRRGDEQANHSVNRSNGRSIHIGVLKQRCFHSLHAIANQAMPHPSHYDHQCAESCPGFKSIAIDN